MKVTIESETKVLNRLLILDDIFGLDGIQTRIVKKYLPLLNVYIKSFLDILSNGEMAIELFINDKAKVDVNIKGNSGNTFNMLSGGEQEIARLAVSIGLAMLSFSRSAQKPEMICLDEIFGSLDDARIELVFSLLKKLQDQFSRVFVISHKAEINDKIPNQIVIEKMDGYGKSKIKGIRHHNFSV